jgi:hypothetical protein
LTYVKTAVISTHSGDPAERPGGAREFLQLVWRPRNSPQLVWRPRNSPLGGAWGFLQLVWRPRNSPPIIATMAATMARSAVRFLWMANAQFMRQG